MPEGKNNLMENVSVFALKVLIRWGGIVWEILMKILRSGLAAEVLKLRKNPNRLRLLL